MDGRSEIDVQAFEALTLIALFSRFQPYQVRTRPFTLPNGERRRAAA
jgi:hypothetical protein